MNFSSFDARSVSCVERVCRRIEGTIGRSNYFWLKLLTGGYAIFLIALVFANERYRILPQSGHNVFLFLLFLWFFYVAFFYCDRAHEFAKKRISENEANPKKTSGIYVPIRCSTFVSMVLLLLFCFAMAIQFPSRMSDVPLVAYMLVSCVTAFCFWMGLLLDACDPLPQKTHPAQ